MPAGQGAAMLPPGSIVGILGGGQLGRMLALAAAELGMACHIFAEEENPPAAQTAQRHIRARFDDAAAVGGFAQGVDVLTYEFENIPLETLQQAAEIRPLRPSVHSLETTRDRLTEKIFLCRQGFATAPFAAFNSADGLKNALGEVGLPAIAKTRRLGYDGKGQHRLRREDDIPAVLEALAGAPAIVEGVVDFTAEAAVVLARADSGEVRCFDVTATSHEAGILRRAHCPAGLHPALEKRAQEMAAGIAEALGHVGVLAVEFFLLGAPEDGGDAESRLLVNEIAPRVHNSGHWTRQACLASQFEQHIRAVCGWPLAQPSRHSDAEMVNLIGEEAESWERHAAEAGASVHLYGKKEARPGRKMGHLVRLRPRSAA